jgi:hypothetical protein
VKEIAAHAGRYGSRPGGEACITSPSSRRALMVAAADLLEQIDQTVDALGAGSHQPQAGSWQSMSASSRGMLLKLPMNLELDRCPSGHGEGPAKLPAALPGALV